MHEISNKSNKDQILFYGKIKCIISLSLMNDFALKSFSINYVMYAISIYLLSSKQFSIDLAN